MPERGSSAGAVLEALGFAVFVRDYSGALRLESVETVLRCSRPR